MTVRDVLLCWIVVWMGMGSSWSEPWFSLHEEVTRIGNQEDERIKLQLLGELKTCPQLSAQDRKDLLRLITEIERWNDSPRLEYFSKDIREKMEWDFHLSPDSPFRSLTDFYQARMLIGCAMEYGNIWGNEEEWNRYLGKAKNHLQAAKQAFPENRLIRMYLGEPIIQPEFSIPPGTPLWAVYQREGLQRLSDIVIWWIENRVRENGEYGGGWGDDCEMWRWWIPVLIAFDDPRIVQAQSDFSSALLGQSHMQGGYTSHMSDVEHTAEDSSDAMTPMMHLDPDNPQWRDRALRLADLMENLWTGTNQRGFLQFKSTYFTSEQVDDRTERACDSVYHPRAVQPALLYWQRTGDSRLTQLFRAWMDTWVDAAARSERGKPIGIIPSTIHWPSGSIGGVGENWWDPQNYSETLYRWPSAMEMMLNSFLLTYHMTASESYLQPIRSMAAIRLRYLQHPPTQALQPGSESWCASRMNLSGVLTKYRFLVGNDEFDELLQREANPYFSFRVHNREEPLIQALRQTAEALRTNFAGYTSEVRYTDRCLRFPAFLQRSGWNSSSIHLPDPNLLYATATGDPGDPLYFPLNRVRWLTPPRDIAARVTDSDEDRFQAELYHFGKKDRSMGAELYLLGNGDYQYSIQADEQVFMAKNFVVNSPRTRIDFILPSQRLCTLIVKESHEPQ